MDEILDSVQKTNLVPVGHRLAKMLLAATAGFIAGELVKNAYDKFVLDRPEEILNIAD